MTNYCGPCLADLALVRDAATAVNGTAACMAHAVLLTHPGDTPQRRLARLAELREMAESKLLTASPEEAARIELLVQEYALAGAMDMSVPLKELAGDRTPRPPKKRNRGRDRDRPDRPDRVPRPGGTTGSGEEAPADGAGAGPQVEPAPGVEPGPEAMAPQAVPASSESAAPAPSEPAAPAAPAPSEPAAPAESAPAPSAPDAPAAPEGGSPAEAPVAE